MAQPKISNFSRSQLKALTWWCPGSPYWDMEAVICDGAVRSGKTLCMGLSFFLWAMESFNGENFAVCGRSVKSVRRNVVSAVEGSLRELGYEVREKGGVLSLSRGKRQNNFHLFGGCNSLSASVIQGMTLAGLLLDEVVLMPRSFVEQAMARCSVPGSRLWFNCNPESPQHWFYREWICRAEERRALYIHFRMEDNPGLSPEIVERYKRMYTGTFHRRFILGEWVASEGLVYDFFSPQMMEDAPEGKMEKWVISCDYGTSNPASFGLWGLRDGVWYRVKEYYFDSRREGRQKTDGEYVEDIRRLADGRKIERIVADPSAASFILALARAGFRVQKAKNEVLSGIRTTAEMLKNGKIVICRGCSDSEREFSLYRWQEDAKGDKVQKEHDHAMDDIRYFAHTVAAEEERESLAAMTVERRGLACPAASFKKAIRR